MIIRKPVRENCFLFVLVRLFYCSFFSNAFVIFIVKICHNWNFIRAIHIDHQRKDRCSAVVVTFLFFKCKHCKLKLDRRLRLVICNSYYFRHKKRKKLNLMTCKISCSYVSIPARQPVLCHMVYTSCKANVFCSSFVIIASMSMKQSCDALPMERNPLARKVHRVTITITLTVKANVTRVSVTYKVKLF